MADLDLVNRECEKRLRTFKSLLRRHDPSGTDPGVVVEFYQTWGQELSIALSSLEESVSNMIIDHKAAMSTDAINQWEQNLVESEQKYREHRAATFLLVNSARTVAAPAPTASRPDPSPAPESSNSSARVKAAEVKTVIEAERISAEGKELNHKIKRYDDW